MFLPIDVANGLPIYRQIMDQVRRMAASGALKAGQQIPSVREASATLQINPLTVGKAYGELEREGVLEMRRGLGMFAAAGAVRGGEARRESVRKAAGRLALEAAQAGLSREQAQRLLGECWKDLESGT